MSIQVKSPLGKIAYRSCACTLILVVGTIGLFVSKQSAFEQLAIESPKPRTYAGIAADQSTGIDSKINASAEEVKKIPINYSDHLPPLETVIAEFSSLEPSEIDEKIKEVDQDLANSELIEKSNAQTLDEAGYRQLAQLMQLSDALYHVKIDRQLSSLESDLGIKRKGT